MAGTIISGLVWGIALSFMFGSVFFALVQNSLSHGFKSGVMIAIGVIFSDLLLITIALHGVHFITHFPSFGFYTKLVGSTFLLALGVSNFFDQAETGVKAFTNSGKNAYFVSKGFVMNFFNPANLFLWISTATHLLVNENMPIWKTYIFFASCVAAIFFSELAVSYFASWIKVWIKDVYLCRLKKGFGILYILLGIILIFR